MKKRFSDEQIISILREAEAGVSFFVSSPSGRRPAETSNFLFLLVLSLHRPIMIGGLASLCF